MAAATADQRITMLTPPAGITEAEVARTKQKLRALIHAIEAHPLLTSDPARDAPKALFFTWDFVRRTESNLRSIDVQAIVADDEVALEAYEDCLGRIALSDKIISDPVCCRLFTQSEPVDFGAEVRARAADI